MEWINGLYIARSLPNATPVGITLVIRIDSNEQGDSLSQISVDMYTGILPDALLVDVDFVETTVSQYKGSWRTKSPIRLASRASFQTTLSRTDIQGGDLRLKFRLHDSADPGYGAIEYRADPSPDIIPTEILLLRAKWSQPQLRNVRLEVDRQVGLPNPLESLQAVVPSVSGLKLTFDEILSKAGLQVRRNRSGENNISPPSGGWTLEHLKSMARQKSFAQNPRTNSMATDQINLRVYLMIVDSLPGDRSIVGAMFDRTERRGAAVFYETLRSTFGSQSIELDSNFMFTVVHELAHCLNLAHSFEGLLPGLSKASATFTNYPQNYNGAPGSRLISGFRGGASWPDDLKDNYHNFWRKFSYSFEAEELLQLRHGVRKDIFTGPEGKVTQYRGLFSGAAVPLVLGDPSRSTLQLSINVRGGPRPGAVQRAKLTSEEVVPGRCIFDFGEPIVIEARLRSFLKGAQLVETPLSVVSEGLIVQYETPSGHYGTFVPPFTLCKYPEAKMLDADSRTTTPDAFYKDICLNYTDGGVSFTNPGRYKLRASFLIGDTLLVSNVLEIFVRYPDRRVEDVVVPLLDSDVASYFAFRGLHGSHGADNLLFSTFFDDDGSFRNTFHPLFRYFCAGELKLRKQGVVAFDKDGHLQWAKRGGPSVERLVAGALSLPDLSLSEDVLASSINNLPFSNISLGKVSKLAFGIMRTDMPEFASVIASSVDKAFKLRRVPTKFRRKYLPPKPKDLGQDLVV